MAAQAKGQKHKPLAPSIIMVPVTGVNVHPHSLHDHRRSTRASLPRETMPTDPQRGHSGPVQPLVSLLVLDHHQALSRAERRLVEAVPRRWPRPRGRAISHTWCGSPCRAGGWRGQGLPHRKNPATHRRTLAGGVSLRGLYAHAREATHTVQEGFLRKRNERRTLSMINHLF